MLIGECSKVFKFEEWFQSSLEGCQLLTSAEAVTLNLTISSTSRGSVSKGECNCELYLNLELINGRLCQSPLPMCGRIVDPARILHKVSFDKRCRFLFDIQNSILQPLIHPKIFSELLKAKLRDMKTKQIRKCNSLPLTSATSARVVNPSLCASQG
jgi:hypothetical protein